MLWTIFRFPSKKAIVEPDGTLSIIDGVQRLSTIRDYIEDK